MYSNGGFIAVVGACGACHVPFVFNPNKVPSKDNIPFCKTCVDMANPIRVQSGLPLIIYDDDAYQPIKEEDLT